MKFGHRLHGTITGYDDKGRGLLRLDETTADKTRYDLGKGVVALPFAARGDEVVATFVKRDHGTKVARIEQVTTPSTDRIAAPCPHAGVCGGCLWQHLDYPAQLKLKQKMINKAFEGAGHEERIEEVLSICHSREGGPPVREAGKPVRTKNLNKSLMVLDPRLRGDDTRDEKTFYYRNRMDYAIGWLGTIGLKEYGSWNRYLDLSTCLLLSPETPEILQIVREIMREHELEPWDAKHHTGLMRYVVIREGKNTKQRLVMLVVSDLARLGTDARQAIKDRLIPLSTSLILGEQSLPTDLSYVQKIETLEGQPWLEENVNEIHYRIAPNSFFQTNTGMAARLQETVDDFLSLRGVATTKQSLETNPTDSLLKIASSAGPSRNDKQRIVLDLYCGLGFFGIYLAKQHPDLTVHGFEIDAEAIELAKHNAVTNEVIDQCHFTSGPAEDLSWKNLDVDAIILDPPRAGLHPRVIQTILDRKPQTIVYVSCNYHRLVEELKQFKTMYRIERMTALDLFPHTPHVEVVVKLVLKSEPPSC